MIRRRSIVRGVSRASRALFSLLLAAFLALLVFLVLPLMEKVGRRMDDDWQVVQVDTAELPPPPPPVVNEEPEDPPDEPPPPEMAEEAAPLDLSELELALNPGFGEGLGGDFAIQLDAVSERAAEEADAIISSSDLDQPPRVLSQAPPTYPASLRGQKLGGTVQVMFTVDKHGRVVKPKVQSSTHPAFEEPALRAVSKWKFEPGRRKGQPVAFKMRIPITFKSG